MKRFIAFSGGVESSAMCVLYGNQATPIFTDTGFEHKVMYRRIDQMEQAIRVIHGTEGIIRIQAKNVEKTGTDDLPSYIRHRKFYPNPMARFCTRIFKIKPMDDFLSTQGECEVFIGLNADEEEEREGNYGECENVTYRYPLIEDGKTRKDCEDVLKKYGLMPNFPPYMHRGGCIGCFFKGKQEYRIMAHLAPEEALMVAELEESIQDKRSNHYHIHSGIPNMRKFIEDCQKENFLFPVDEMFRTETTGKGCGVFCHR